MKRTLLAVLIFTALVPLALAQAPDPAPAAKAEKTFWDYNLEIRAARAKGDFETWAAAGAEVLKLAPIALK
jgi:hypothetical protein